MPTPPVVVHECTVPIRDWPQDLAGLQIAHVSDFHFRRWNETLRYAQNLLATFDYDLLLITGDFCNFRWRWRHAAEITRRFFDPLADRAPIYAVLGNHDNPQLPTAEDLPLTFLRNQTIRVRVRGGELNLAGIEQTKPRGGDLDATLATIRPDAPTVLLTHYPSTAFRVPQGRVQVVLSGHTHGGQIRLPWLGCVWPNDRIPRRLARGLHEVNGIKVRQRRHRRVAASSRSNQLPTGVVAPDPHADRRGLLAIVGYDGEAQDSPTRRCQSLTGLLSADILIAGDAWQGRRRFLDNRRFTQLSIAPAFSSTAPARRALRGRYRVSVWATKSDGVGAVTLSAG